jgi:hypothetical protein
VTPPRLLERGFFVACRTWHARPTRFVLAVSVQAQRMDLFERVRRPSDAPAPVPGVARTFPQTPICSTSRNYGFRRRLLISTSRHGVGQLAGSHRTPLGLHRVAAKIGDGWPAGTVFRSRAPVGFTWQGLPDAPIAHRILWLEGLEPGLNRGGNVDSFARYIYLHGVGDETTLGRPASRGCVHAAAKDLIPLFDRLPIGTLVWIAP